MLVIFIAIIAALLVPGIDFFNVFTHSIKYPKRNVLVLVMGITIAISIVSIITLTILNYSSQYNNLMYIIHISGAIFLVFIGITFIRNSLKGKLKINLEVPESQAYPLSKSFKLGLFRGLFNPKSYGFQISIWIMAFHSNLSITDKITILLIIPISAYVYFSFCSVVLKVPAINKKCVMYSSYLTLCSGIILIMIACYTFIN